MTKRQVTPHRPIYPTPAGLITSVDASGRPNVLTLGEVVVQHVDEDVLDNTGGISVGKLRGFAFVHGESWTPGERMPRG